MPANDHSTIVKIYKKWRISIENVLVCINLDLYKYTYQDVLVIMPIKASFLPNPENSFYSVTDSPLSNIARYINALLILLR